MADIVQECSSGAAEHNHDNKQDQRPSDKGSPALSSTSSVASKTTKEPQLQEIKGLITTTTNTVPSMNGLPQLPFNPFGSYGIDPATLEFAKNMGSFPLPPTPQFSASGFPGFGPSAADMPQYQQQAMYHPYDRLGHQFDMRRKNATRETTAPLKAWLYEHRKNPYPTKGEKIMLAIISKMTLTQVSTWFANARRRLKKENKMTWSPRNRPGSNGYEGGDSDDDDVVEEAQSSREECNNNMEREKKVEEKQEKPKPKIWSIEETLRKPCSKSLQAAKPTNLTPASAFTPTTPFPSPFSLPYSPFAFPPFHANPTQFMFPSLPELPQFAANPPGDDGPPQLTPVVAAQQPKGSTQTQPAGSQ